MKMKKMLALVCAALFAMTALAACGGKEEAAPAEAAASSAKSEAPAEKAEEGGSKYKVGVSLPSMEFTFFATMKTDLEDAFPTDEVEVTVYDGENNQEKQNKDVEDMITLGYDGIVLIPITVEGAIPAIEYANSKNVPVITVDRQVTADAGVDVIGFVGSDHKPMGVGSAELLIAALEEKFPDEDQWNIIEIEGTQGASATLLRGEGIHEVIDANDKINLIASYDGDFSTNNALAIAEDALTANSDLHGIICHNDDEARGAYQALVNANRVGDVVITGIDGQKETVQLIADGAIQGTVVQYPKMVCMGVDVLVDYLNGNEVDEINYYPTDKCAPEDAAKFIEEGKCW